MLKITTATYGSADILENIFDDLVNIGLPSEKIFINQIELQVKVISGPEIEAEILEVINRHNPTESQSHKLKEQETAKVITATYTSSETLKNVADDLINIGLPAEEFFTDKKNKQVKVIAGSAIESEIKEVLNRHDPAVIAP